MTCTGCETTVVNAANTVDGVLEAQASYENHPATVTFDKTKTNESSIVKAKNKTGFMVTNYSNN